jgi:hypothetical protein
LIFSLVTGCKTYNLNQIEGKWQVVIEDDIYYERWVSENSMIWYNSEFGIQLWKFNFDGRIISYQYYDEEKNTTSDTNLEETIVSLNKKTVKVNVTTNPSGVVSYSLKRINFEKFTTDFTNLDLNSVLDEIKERQYQYFSIK